jgi:hypothetical protein
MSRVSCLFLALALLIVAGLLFGVSKAAQKGIPLQLKQEDLVVGLLLGLSIWAAWLARKRDAD